MSDLTTELWRRYGSLSYRDLPDDVRTVATHCILDWFGCALAGSQEPLAEILRDEFGLTQGNCTILGSDLRASASHAALINGAAGHALDFDDTHPIMLGHSTVPILPAALAVAEEQHCSGEELIAAFVVGVELACRLGAAIGPEHYAKGWHVTSSIGVFGATAAAAKLLGLDDERFGHAIGLAASRSNGLKANFGTMTKPLHAGNAAESGVVAARLASRGFTANPDAFSSGQGLVEAAGGGTVRLQDVERLSERWLIESTLFKYHAACYLTHAAIEATGSLNVAAGDLEKAMVTVNPALLDICAIAHPKTGLEAKFSLAATIAITLLGDDTADPATFNDTRVNEPAVKSLIERVEVKTDELLSGTQSRLRLEMRDGAVHETECDTGIPASDLDTQGRKLRAKYTGIARPVLGERSEVLAQRIERLAELGDAVLLSV